MDTINIRVLTEVVACQDCKEVNHLYYISDFAYGCRLYVYGDGIRYAYLNLIEDVVFDTFRKVLRSILSTYNIDVANLDMPDIVNNTFGITFDDIDGFQVSSMEKRRCKYCSSTHFVGNLLEPETVAEIEVPLITHRNWMLLSDNEKNERIVEALKAIGVIK